MKGGNILVVAEATGGGVHASTLELLTLAQRLRAASGGEVCVALHEDGVATSAAAALGRCGVDVVYRTVCAELARIPVEARLPAIRTVWREVQPAVVLFAHDLLGVELGPRLAFSTGAAVVTGCIDLTLEHGLVRGTRPCYGGLAHEVGEFDGVAVVATVRGGLYERVQQQADRCVRVVELGALEPSASRVKLVERSTESDTGPRIEDAGIVVAGGRGLDGAAGFAVLRDLAQALDAALGASRVPCDLGWCAHSMQIGLTGKTVTPELYIAVGISGASHHMAGCANARTIVAINSDPEAAIFQDARFGVIGDYREVVPALAARVRELKQA